MTPLRLFHYSASTTGSLVTWVAPTDGWVVFAEIAASLRGTGADPQLQAAITNNMAAAPFADINYPHIAMLNMLGNAGGTDSQFGRVVLNSPVRMSRSQRMQFTVGGSNAAWLLSFSMHFILGTQKPRG